ncbi:MAG TPA: sugar phosphate isomerase/epimerase [Roseiflexaceae bacterium]|nr:sugar phosphate isomerase/epimerase [Roseiflexaceae bacterium]HMP41463.1 sugar phosphate isomerase/epimerase [Roseiflexaceae bacterium]
MAAEQAQTHTIERFGVQLFTLAPMLADDPEATLKLVADSGYKEVEFFGPYDFSPPEAIAAWAPLAAHMGINRNAYFGMTPHEIKARLDHYGLSSPSAHADLLTVRARLAELAEAARIIGQRYIVIPSARSETLDTLDDYRRLAAELNEIGARADALGVRFGYHNHGYENAPIDGRIPYEVLLEETDPALVTMELDLFWMIAGGGDPLALLDTYPGRFALLHIKDMSRIVRFAGRGQTPQEWMELFPEMRDAGDGVLDLQTILARAQQAGVQHFLLERDLAAEPLRTLQTSFKALAHQNT